MGTSLPPVLLKDLPRALWVVAATVSTSEHRLLGPEWPLAYRFGFASPLKPDEQVSLTHYLREKPSVGAVRLHNLARPGHVPHIPQSTSVWMTNPDRAQQVFETLVSNPQHHRQAIREIKEVVWPECPYTALVIHSAHKLPGNTGLIWVVVRDELTCAERSRLSDQITKVQGVHSAITRGTSTFELRVDYRLVTQYDRLTSPLAALGVYPDFRAEAGATTYEKAVDQTSGL